jgi:phytoene dehydrogenase-like protein
LWAAVSEYIPNAKARAELGTVQVGTPLTHQRFLRRSNGSYGPRAVAGSGKSLPGHKTPLDGLWLCGDYTFPGTLLYELLIDHANQIVAMLFILSRSVYAGSSA